MIGSTDAKWMYGDRTARRLKHSRAALLENAIHPIQQFDPTKGEKTTDSAMIMDAMFLLYAGNVASER